MKLIYILAVIVNIMLFLLIVWKVFQKFNEMEPETQIQKFQEKLKEKEVVPVVPDVVKKVNARNSQIQSLVVKDMDVSIWEEGSSYNLDGELFYQKDDCFRMIISSFFGDELDLGANEEIFWYWSRRDRDPGVYYASYEDYSKTRLKTPFNPIFLRESLGLAEIEVGGSEFIEKEDFVAVVRSGKNAMGKEIIYTTIIDRVKERVEGILITDKENKPLASCEIQGYVGDIPRKLLFLWHEENRIMLLEFANPRTNLQILDSRWKLPNRDHKINMGEE